MDIHIAEQDFSIPDADEGFDGDPPSCEEIHHHEEVASLIFQFNKLALPDIDLIFEGRYTLSLFDHRTSKLELHEDDQNEMVAAAGQALSAFEKSNVGWRLRYLRKGFQAIIAEILWWANTHDYRETVTRDERLDHQAYFQCLRNEIRTADLAFSIRHRRAAKTVNSLKGLANQTARIVA
ncbi:hypothetical protein [Mesorhizobium sp. M0243]|uniref:hypothetical protein n=1 Tax=Mesorhizobium sp. M0243 TaxID=2956925 RepID=UPI0033373FEA